MKTIILNAINQRKITIFVMIIVMVMGMMSYNLLPKQKSPTIEVGTAMITTIYPGASAEEVEKEITSKIEERLAAFSEYKETMGYSQPSVSVVLYTVEVVDDYADGWEKLRREMQNLQKELPQGCEAIEIETDFMETAGVIYSISGQSYSYDELEWYAEKIKEHLLPLSGVNRVEIVGMLEDELLITIDNQALSYIGIGYDELVQLLQTQNIEIPSGQLDGELMKVPVKVSGYYKTIEEIENTIISISKEEGIVTRLKDIGRIDVSLEELSYKVKSNNRPSLLVVIYFDEDKNIIPVGKEMTRIMQDTINDIPKDVSLSTILFQPTIVEAELHNFIMSLLQGILLVIAVVFLGMGLRNALIVSVAIPMSIMITFVVMQLMGIKIHQISIVGLIISLGMLVDNAIVVSDAIQVRIDKSEERLSACMEGTREVAIPMLTSTLTTICTFSPLLLMTGDIGSYLYSLPVIVISALIASYVVAIFVTPTLAYMLFRPKNKTTVEFKIIDKLLMKAMQHKVTVYLSLVLGLIACGVLFNSVGMKFFPYADTNMLVVEITNEIADDIDGTELITDEVVGKLLEVDEVIEVVSAIGDGLPRFFDTMFPAFPSKDYSQLLVLVDKKAMMENESVHSMTDFRDRLQVYLSSEIVSAKVLVKQLEQGEPVGYPVTLRLTGDDFELLGEIGDEIKEKLETIPGAINVNNDFYASRYEYCIDLDRLKASHRGVSSYDVQKTVNIALRGSGVGYLKGKSEMAIKLKSDISTIQELNSIAIKSSITDKKYILGDISDASLRNNRSLLTTYNGAYSISVFSDVLSGYSAVDIQKELISQLPEGGYRGIKIIAGGESQSIDNNFSEIAFIGLIFIMFIYGILLVQFKSYLIPIIILLTIPLSMMGSIIGLFITQTSLSFTGFLGMISLAGIVVNNAIILIDYILSEMNGGANKVEACIKAAQKRSRPIILSTMTTVIGLIPLVMMGSELFTPMAITLMSGLLVSTLLTLVIIPVTASILLTNPKA